MFSWLPGVGDLESAARGEIGNLNATRQGFDGKYDIGDRFRGLLGGYTEEEVRRKAAELRRADINRSLSSERTRASMALEGTGLRGGGNKIQEGQTEEDFASSLTRDTATGTLAQQYLSMPNASIDDLSPNDGAATIRNKASQLTQSNKEKEEQKNKAEVIRQEGRQDARQAELDRRYYADKKEQRLDRAEERLATKEVALLGHKAKLIELEQIKQRDAYEMQKYQYELAHRKEQAREKRTSNLIQALAGLGAAFAI